MAKVWDPPFYLWKGKKFDVSGSMRHVMQNRLSEEKNEKA